MNIEEARAWLKANWASEEFNASKYYEAKSFIEGYESGRREALESEAVKEFKNTIKGDAACGDGCDCGDGWLHELSPEALARFEQFKQKGK